MHTDAGMSLLTACPGKVRRSNAGRQNPGKIRGITYSKEKT
jgi:hypothetical protein